MQAKVEGVGARQFRGITWDRSSGRWKSQIQIEGKRKHLGLFTTRVDAARAYDVAAFKRDGERALLNFPESIDDYSGGAYDSIGALRRVGGAYAEGDHVTPGASGDASADWGDDDEEAVRGLAVLAAGALAAESNKEAAGGDEGGSPGSGGASDAEGRMDSGGGGAAAAAFPGHGTGAGQRAGPAPKIPGPRGGRSKEVDNPFLTRGRSGFIGVTRPKDASRWRAQIQVEGRTVNIGTFNTLQEAARAYDVAAITRDGPSAVLNYPADTYKILDRGIVNKVRTFQALSGGGRGPDAVGTPPVLHMLERGTSAGSGEERWIGPAVAGDAQPSPWSQTPPMKCRICGLGWEALEGGFLACSICEESGTHVKCYEEKSGKALTGYGNRTGPIRANTTCSAACRAEASRRLEGLGVVRTCTLHPQPQPSPPGPIPAPLPLPLAFIPPLPTNTQNNTQLLAALAVAFKPQESPQPRPETHSQPQSSILVPLTSVLSLEAPGGTPERALGGALDRGRSIGSGAESGSAMADGGGAKPDGPPHDSADTGEPRSFRYAMYRYEVGNDAVKAILADAAKLLKQSYKSSHAAFTSSDGRPILEKILENKASSKGSDDPDFSRNRTLVVWEGDSMVAAASFKIFGNRLAIVPVAAVTTDANPSHRLRYLQCLTSALSEILQSCRVGQMVLYPADRWTHDALLGATGAKYEHVGRADIAALPASLGVEAAPPLRRKIMDPSPRPAVAGTKRKGLDGEDRLKSDMDQEGAPANKRTSLGRCATSEDGGGSVAAADAAAALTGTAAGSEHRSPMRQAAVTAAGGAAPGASGLWNRDAAAVARQGSTASFAAAAAATVAVAPAGAPQATLHLAPGDPEAPTMGSVPGVVGATSPETPVSATVNSLAVALNPPSLDRAWHLLANQCGLTDSQIEALRGPGRHNDALVFQLLAGVLAPTK